MADPKPAAVAIPSGNDPRLTLDRDALEADSLSAMPQVGRASTGSDNLTLLAGMAGLMVLAGVTWFSLGAHKPAPQPVAQPPLVAAPTSALPLVDPTINPPPAPVLQLQPMPQAVVPVVGAETPAVRAPSMVIDNSMPEAQSAAASSAAAAQAAGGGKSMLNSNDQFIASQNSDISQKATRIGDPSQVVPQGAVIPAVLETAINSDLPGYTRAIVSRDIRSFDGTTVLIPRGSRLIGQYKSGLTSGETRAFIIWNRLIRPDGVSVQLVSPATDDLGQAGMAGTVNTHFVKRFGSAILLSIVGGLSSALGNNGGTNNTVVISSGSNPQGQASDALSNDAQIPPTIKVPQGQPIQVFVARDLDFNLGK